MRVVSCTRGLAAVSFTCDHGAKGGRMTDVGDLYPLGVLVRDEDGAALNANVVALTITKPDLTIVQPPVANPPAETGRYVVDYVPDQPGPYRYRWVATSPSLVFEGSFDVEEPGVVGLVGLDVAKKILRIPLNEHDYDDDVLSVTRAATAAVELETGKVPIRRTIVEHRFLRQPTYRYAVRRRPILALTSIERLQNGIPIVTILPPWAGITEAGIVSVASSPIWGAVRTTYVAGPAITPPNVREAAGYIIEHLWANRRGSSSRPRIGGQAASDDTVSTYSIPNRARDLLGRRGPLVG
jgi:hypothetical protein